MARLPASTRLTYMGLWGLADDAGYLEWSPAEIAAALYRWQDRQYREPRVTAELQTLIEEGRIEILDCGRHAVVPTIVDHRIKGGETLFTVQKRHETKCSIAMTEPYVVLPAKSKSATTEDSVSLSSSSSVSDSDSGSTKPRSPAPMSPERALELIEDPKASEEAKAGARGYLELRQRYGKPAKLAASS